MLSLWVDIFRQIIYIDSPFYHYFFLASDDNRINNRNIGSVLWGCYPCIIQSVKSPLIKINNYYGLHKNIADDKSINNHPFFPFTLVDAIYYKFEISIFVYIIIVDERIVWLRLIPSRLSRLTWRIRIVTFSRIKWIRRLIRRRCIKCQWWSRVGWRSEKKKEKLRRWWIETRLLCIVSITWWRCRVNSTLCRCSSRLKRVRQIFSDTIFDQTLHQT